MTGDRMRADGLCFFCVQNEEENENMPRNQFQRMVFAFLTVVVNVHAYVFYSLYVVNGGILMSITGADSVIHAINSQGGVYMFGRMLPIRAVILIEFCFAYGLECLMGSPCSFKLACYNFPFAFFTQLFFIQPLVRTVFKILFRKDIAARQESM